MATTGAEALLIDTSVLVEATNLARSQHRQALALLEADLPLSAPSQVWREFLVVATRPANVNGLGLSIEYALENVEALRTRVRLLPDEKPLLPTLLGLCRRFSITGKRVHDANIVAAAVVHRIKRIVTLNVGDFAPFASLVGAITPRALDR